ncbi:MAG: hypothetical protein RL662_1894 [Bacteroidota bacterium]|jgi:TonB-linked SusC/RagA family outer membrane protein
MKKLILILTCILASIGLSVAQTTRVTGTVIDDTGETVIGASVVAKGTTVGTVTDLDGVFSLDIPSDKKTVVITLIGYKAKEVVAGTNIKVTMEPDTKLISEVVVTAMGISREKKALGYAAQGVSSDKLVQASNPSLAGSLQGKVSGIQITPSSGMPGASSRIVIRGARSFTGNNTPLYIVDGMPINSTSDIDSGNSTTGADIANRAVDIDPNDIESIDILKGQAASALYGIRASNGVVVITTKSGKNLKKGKPSISISSTVSFEKPSRYPEYQQKYSQGVKGKFNPTSSSSWGALISELPNDPTYGGNVANDLNGGDTQKYQGKYYVPQLKEGGMDPWVAPGVYNNLKDFFNTGVSWNNSINVAQALDKSSYSISLGYTTQDGIIPETGMNRYTAKVGAETKLTDQWTSGFTANYVNTGIDKAPGANQGIMATLYASPVSYNYKGIPYHVKDDPYTQTHFRARGFENAYWATKNDLFTEETSRFFGNGFVNYTTKLNSTDKKLNLKYQLGADAYTTHYSDLFAYGSRIAPLGEIENNTWSSTTVNSLLIGNFDWTINEDLRFNGILGNELINSTEKRLIEKGTNFAFPGWNQMNNATTQSVENRQFRKRTVGFFGQASFVYKSMLFLDITGRRDIVSTMPRGNRSFFYPSVGTSFIVSELDGVKNDVINFLKLRASYAQVGQAGEYFENYFYKPSYGGGFYSGEPIQYPINSINGFTSYYKRYDPNLKPQNTQSYELGFDLTVLKGLFDLNFTYARQNVTDQIFAVPLPGSTGFESLLTNGGKVHTNSYEATLNVNPVRTKLVDWSIGFNFSKIDNYVDELIDDVTSVTLGGFVSPQVRVQKGYKFPVIYGTDYERDAQGRILVDDKGMPISGKNDVIGKASPNFNLGINTSLRIEKLNISAVFDWKNGGQMYHGTLGLLNFYGVGKDTENRDQPILFDGWKKDGTKNDIYVQPKDQETYYSTVNNIDASSIYDNGFFKLRELTLSYPILQKTGLEISANAFARNILIWSELPSFDPETSQGNNNMAGDFERFSVPQASSYGFGVNVKF